MAKHQDVHYFAGASADHSSFGHVWRMWSHGTSFYLSARNQSMAMAKFSLHGPDPRPGMSPVFKFGYVRNGGDGLLAAGDLPLRIPGGKASDDTLRVLRFRFRPQMYDGLVPNGLGYEKEVGQARAILVTVPDPGHVADLDFYVSTREPSLRRDVIESGAVVGPITNSAGQWLTGISHRRSEPRSPTPSQASELPPDDPDDAVRGHWIGMAGCAFAWVVETSMSRKAFRRELAAPPAFRAPLAAMDPSCVASLAARFAWQD